MQYLIDRLAEQSTWRGLILLATSLGLVLSPEQQAAIIALGLAAVGSINVFRKEKK